MIRKECILIEVVRQIINDADPESLLKMNCPKDEYEPEIGAIFEKMNDSLPGSPKACANIVALVWFWYFGDASEPFQFPLFAAEVGQKLWDAMEAVRMPNQS